MEKISAILSTIPLFKGLSRDQLEEIGGIASEKYFSRGEIIFTEGDDGNGFYVVVGGSVKGYKLSPDGKEKILHIFTPGQPFGEVPVFAGEQFPVSAEAITDTRALFLPRAAFLELIGKNPLLALKMLADLSRKLRQFAVQIENLTLKETPARLATYLLLLSEEQGRADEVTLRISKGHLASLLGTIPETLSRVFAKLAGQELIEVKGRKIALRDPEGLRDLSETGRGAA
jgi:CRP/FNR family transcriptional regulator